jgi:endonuclease YncB( thermonuclease family)
MRAYRIAALAGFCLLATPAFAAPDCAGEIEIDTATIVRVEPNAALILRDGRAVHLEGIRMPDAAHDHAPGFLTDQAFAALDAMTRGHRLTIRAVPPKEDRYDRVRGQAFDRESDGAWVQAELLKRGLVRVDIAPDRTECAAELYEAEAQARAAHLGLWSSSAYAVRTPDTLGADTGTFQLVEGKVLNADVRDGRAYLNFGADWKTDFTVTISPADMANFRRDGIDPRSYIGKTIRVRGLVQQLSGPEIEIANARQIEVVN